MTTTAWRFSGTEGADEAVLKLKQLEAAKLVEVQDTTVIRWPQYAAEPTVREHVTEEGSKVSSLVHKIKHSGIDSSMVLSAKGDMTPGTSVLVLLTPEAAVDAFAQAFEGQGVELIRSDLSVQEQDEHRVPRGHVTLGRQDHRAIDAGMRDLVNERRNLAALLCHVLAYGGLRSVLRPADNSGVLHLDELRGL